MKLQQLHQMLQPLTLEVRKRVVRQLAIRQAMLKAGVTIADHNKISQQQAESQQQSDKGERVGDILRNLADIEEKGKISKLGGFKSSTGFDAVWDASLTVVSAALRGSATLADAIDAGLNHIKQTDWYKNLTDKKDFDDKYVAHLEGEFRKFEKESKDEKRLTVTSIKNEQVDKERAARGLSSAIEAAKNNEKQSEEIRDVHKKIEETTKAYEDALKSSAERSKNASKEAFATSIVSVGKMLDKGLDLKEAIEKGTEEMLNKLREIHGTLSHTFEQQVRDGFKKDTQEVFQQEAEKPVKRIKKISLITIGIIFLFLLITNPSMKQFKEFDNGTSHRRISNYLIFSVFENSTDKYLGIAFNFFKIGESSEPAPVLYYHSPD